MSLERVTVEQMRGWEAQEADMLIVAGYPWKIPVSEKIRQLNIHPAYLPIGRGSWPMLVAIQRGTDSGVTLHKLSEQFDAGDILLQEKIKIEQEDHLVTLLEKIKKVFVKLLSEYLSSPDEIWDYARAQGEGEYWEEPGDLERTFSLEDTVEKISTTLRAFYGYGSLCNLQGLPVEIIRGSIVNDNRDVDGKLCIPVKGRYLICEEWRIHFRKIELRDKERMEAIRRKYQPMLSDYTFSLLYCWQEELKLSLYIEEEFFVIRGEDYYFFPIGEPNRVKEFIEGKYEYQKADADSDYVLLNQTICELQGSRFYVMKSCIDTIGARYRYKKTVRIIYVIKNRRYSKRSIPRRQ